MNYHRETEEKMHEMLYNNLKLLKQSYPTSKEFDSVFKNDMFVHNNKAAFHQVGRYLLMIIDATLTTEKIASWPCFDLKTEAKFRSEFLTCITHLKLTYENSGIPAIMASHLISPGGYKFVHFIFSLSQLALLEHLKREDVEVIGMPTPSNNIETTKIIIKTYETKTSSIEEKTIKLRKDFEETKESAFKKAKFIAEKVTQINEEFIALQESSFERGETPKSLEIRLQMIESKIEEFNKALLDVKRIKSLSKECGNLVETLLENDFEFEYKINSSKDSNNKLDMCGLFEGADVVLKFLTISLPIFDPSDMNNAQKSVSDITDRYENLNRCFEDLQNNVRTLFENVEMDRKGKK